MLDRFGVCERRACKALEQPHSSPGNRPPAPEAITPEGCSATLAALWWDGERPLEYNIRCASIGGRSVGCWVDRGRSIRVRARRGVGRRCARGGRWFRALARAASTMFVLLPLVEGTRSTSPGLPRASIHRAKTRLQPKPLAAQVMCPGSAQAIAGRAGRLSGYLPVRSSQECIASAQRASSVRFAESNSARIAPRRASPWGRDRDGLVFGVSGTDPLGGGQIGRGAVWGAVWWGGRILGAMRGGVV